MYTSKNKINEVWYSKDKNKWDNALDEYWNRVELDNKSQLDVEKKFDKLNASEVESMPLDEFYSFIIDDYFKWKFNPRDCKNLQHKFYSYYVEEKKLDKLSEIKANLFSFDVTMIKKGLEIATDLHCMRVIAGSGLLAVLFPEYFGTIDRYIIMSLIQIEGLPQHQRITKINKSNPTIDDGIFLVELMRKKAAELNQLFSTDKWRPRDIDKVLWALRENTKQISSIVNHKKKGSLKYKENDNISDLKIAFSKYLRLMGRKEDRIKEDCSWAFTHYNHYIGIDFWDSLRSIEKINECCQCYFKVALNGGFTGKGVKDPKGYASSYMASVKRLKEFLDEEYNGVDNYLNR